MKNRLLLLFVMFFATISEGYAQENAPLVGKWKVIAAQSESFFLDVKNDTIIVSEKVKKLYPTKIGMQDEKASIRTMHSYKIFVFTNKKEFFEYVSDKSKVKYLSGTYAIYNQNKIALDVINLAKTSIKKKASFYLKENLLHLTMHVETNSTVEYILEKVES